MWLVRQFDPYIHTYIHTYNKDTQERKIWPTVKNKPRSKKSNNKVHQYIKLYAMPADISEIYQLNSIDKPKLKKFLPIFI